MRSYEKWSLINSIIASLLALVAIIFSGYFVNSSVEKTFNKSVELNKIQEDKLIKDSAKIVLLEINRIQNISNLKFSDSKEIIKLLKDEKYNIIPGFDLNGQFTLLSDDEWINRLNVLSNNLKPEEYYYLQSYHKAYKSLDTNYPITSINISVSEKSADLEKWWVSFQNIYEFEQNNNQDNKKIVNKLTEITK